MGKGGAKQRIRAAVIGLGQVGSRFDEEPGRRGIWSHAGAYEALNQDFEIIAAVEPDAENYAAFGARMPAVPIYANIAEMIAVQVPEVVSICTPATSHEEVLLQMLAVPDLKAVWCEKPFADNLAAAERMALVCEKRGVPVVVTHNRRFMPLWRQARSMIDEGKVGAIRCVRVAMPNRILSIGSHAVDLAIMLGGKVKGVTPMTIPALQEGGEDAVAALLAYDDGAYGIVQVTGKRTQLVVEAEVLGDLGRISVREDLDCIIQERFCDKIGVAGYKELVPGDKTQHQVSGDHSAFVAAARELAELVRGERVKASCGAKDALAVMEVLDRMTA
jgi:predicted dehydrogenase